MTPSSLFISLGLVYISFFDFFNETGESVLRCRGSHGGQRVSRSRLFHSTRRTHLPPTSSRATPLSFNAKSRIFIQNLNYSNISAIIAHSLRNAVEKILGLLNNLAVETIKESLEMRDYECLDVYREQKSQ